MADPSPSLVWVHSAAGLSRRFRTWFDKACENYGLLLELGGVVDNVLRRERREELTGEERTRFTEALMDFERLEDGLAKFVTSKSYVDFVGVTGEDLIKWVGDEVVSIGYCGFRERSSQYWLWDLRAEKLPYERKVRQVFDFYGVSYRMRIPSQDQSEAMLFEFLENVKKWPRDRLVWLVRNVFPLSDVTGGFFSVARRVVELESLRDAWEDIIRDWKSVAFDVLKKTPQFEVLKTVLLSEWEAERRLRDYIDEVEKEFLDRYGETTADKEKVKAEFLERAKQLFAERTPTEERIREVYEEIKPLVPADKVELTRAGLWKAIRWAFMHPELSVDAFASMHVFPLGFTTEEARAIGAKIMEKVVKKPPVVAPPPIEYVKVRFLKEIPSIVGADMKVYGPFKEGDIAELPKVNAEVLVKQGVATYELVPPPVRSFDELKREFEGKDPVDALAIYVSRYRELQRDYLLEDLHRFLRELKTKLTDEDIYLFYKVYPDLKESFVSIASLIGWIPPPPPAVPPELPTREIEALKGIVMLKAKKMGIEWTPKLWDEFWREYEARSRELWATKGISFVEEEVEDVLRVLAPPPPVVPPEKRPLKEFPAEVDTMRDRLTREAEEIFSSYKIFEHWVTMRDSVVAMIDEVIRKYWHLPFVEAERNIHREFLDRIHEEYVKKLRPPPPPKPPEVAPPPAVPRPPVYPYIPPALEYVELEPDFKKYLETIPLAMEDYRRLDTIAKFVIRDEYRRWRAMPRSS
jgi:hypothetical protein